MSRKSFRHDAILQKGRAAPGRERGASLTEYSLLVALVALAAWGAVRVMAFRIGDCGTLRMSAEAVAIADEHPAGPLSLQEAARIRMYDHCHSVAAPWKEATGWTPSARE